MFVFFLVLCFNIRLAPHALFFAGIEIQDLVHLVESGRPKSALCVHPSINILYKKLCFGFVQLCKYFPKGWVVNYF